MTNLPIDDCNCVDCQNARRLDTTNSIAAKLLFAAYHLWNYGWTDLSGEYRAQAVALIGEDAVAAFMALTYRDKLAAVKS